MKSETETITLQGSMVEQLKKGGMASEDAAGAREAIGKALFTAKGHDGQR